jgi:hypothetical protein
MLIPEHCCALFWQICIFRWYVSHVNFLWSHDCVTRETHFLFVCVSAADFLSVHLAFVWGVITSKETSFQVQVLRRLVWWMSLQGGIFALGKIIKLKQRFTMIEWMIMNEWMTMNDWMKVKSCGKTQNFREVLKWSTSRKLEKKALFIGSMEGPEVEKLIILEFETVARKLCLLEKLLSQVIL